MDFNIAHINIAKMLFIDIKDEGMKEFVNRLDEINTLADISEGFIWRLKSEGAENTSSVLAFEDSRILITMSVWRNIDALYNYIYKTMYTEVMKNRKMWFEKLGKPSMALWGVPENSIPTIEDGKKRLESMENIGPSAFAFDFKTQFLSDINIPHFQSN